MQYFRGQRFSIKKKEPNRRTASERRLADLFALTSPAGPKRERHSSSISEPDTNGYVSDATSTSSSKSVSSQRSSEQTTSPIVVADTPPEIAMQTKPVLHAQKMALIDALSANPAMATSNVDGEDKHWTNLALLLNAIPDGCSGTNEQWWQYWHLWRSFVQTNMSVPGHQFDDHPDQRCCDFLHFQHGNRMSNILPAASSQPSASNAVMTSTLMPVVDWRSTFVLDDTASSMVMDFPIKHRQNMALIDALYENPAMAGDGEDANQYWSQLALTLNADPNIACGSDRQWRQYWQIMRTFVRSKMATTKKYRFAAHELRVRDFLLQHQPDGNIGSSSEPRISTSTVQPTGEVCVYTSYLR